MSGFIMDVRGVGRIYPGELRPTEPPDDVIFGYCNVCDGEIYEGETVYRIDSKLIHEDCLEEFAKDYFANYRTEI